MAARLEIRLSERDRARLEGLAEEDGMGLSEEVRRLVVAEVARRGRRKAGVPESALASVMPCVGCSRLPYR